MRVAIITRLHLDVLDSIEHNQAIVYSAIKKHLHHTGASVSAYAASTTRPPQKLGDRIIGHSCGPLTAGPFSAFALAWESTPEELPEAPDDYIPVADQVPLMYRMSDAVLTAQVNVKTDTFHDINSRVCIPGKIYNRRPKCVASFDEMPGAISLDESRKGNARTWSLQPSTVNLDDDGDRVDYHLNSLINFLENSNFLVDRSALDFTGFGDPGQTFKVEVILTMSFNVEVDIPAQYNNKDYEVQFSILTERPLAEGVVDHMGQLPDPSVAGSNAEIFGYNFKPTNPMTGGRGLPFHQPPTFKDRIDINVSKLIQGGIPVNNVKHPVRHDSAIYRLIESDDSPVSGSVNVTSVVLIYNQDQASVPDLTYTHYFN